MASFKSAVSFPAAAAKSSRPRARDCLCGVPTQTRYRRSTTLGKAPRKRTFVANMQKYLIDAEAPAGANTVCSGAAEFLDACTYDGSNNANGGNGGNNGGVRRLRWGSDDDSNGEESADEASSIKSVFESMLLPCIGYAAIVHTVLVSAVSASQGGAVSLCPAGFGRRDSN